MVVFKYCCAFNEPHDGVMDYHTNHDFSNQIAGVSRFPSHLLAILCYENDIDIDDGFAAIKEASSSRDIRPLLQVEWAIHTGVLVLADDRPHN